MKRKNKCAFCGRPTDYYSYELLCHVCPKCLGEYKNASAVIYPYRYPYVLPEPFLSRQVWWISNSSTSTTSELPPKRKVKK
jgi:hypothetical protein